MPLAPKKIAMQTVPISSSDLVGRAQERASLLPDLLVQAQKVANTATAGWHGRRKRGSGENFWQFRPFADGENRAQIDWRRSARDNTLYIRDKELEAVHTIWLWADPSSRMNFRSTTAQTSKQERALVLTLAMAEILARSGERVGYYGAGSPITHRRAAERLALKIANAPQTSTWPSPSQIKPLSELVIFSDLLEPIDEIVARIDHLAKSQIRGHLVQIVDPAEANFPYQGNVVFNDLESNGKITFAQADSAAERYKAVFQARQTRIRHIATQRGWSYLIHETDQLASTVLIHLHQRLSEGVIR